jgi:hypothetical protein
MKLLLHRLLFSQCLIQFRNVISTLDIQPQNRLGTAKTRESRITRARFCSVPAKHVCAAAAVLCACCYTLLCLMQTDERVAWPSELGQGMPDAHLADA